METAEKANKYADTVIKDSTIAVSLNIKVDDANEKLDNSIYNVYTTFNEINDFVVTLANEKLTPKVSALLDQAKNISIERLKNVSEKIKDDITATIDKIAKTVAKAVKNSVDNFTTANDAATKLIKKYEDEHDKKIDEHDNKIAEHVKKIAEHDNKIAEHVKKIAEHDKKIAEHDKKIEKIKAANEKYDPKIISTLQNQITDIEKKIKEEEKKKGEEEKKKEDEVKKKDDEERKKREEEGKKGEEVEKKAEELIQVQKYKKEKENIESLNTEIYELHQPNLKEVQEHINRMVINDNDVIFFKKYKIKLLIFKLIINCISKYIDGLFISLIKFDDKGIEILEKLIKLINHNKNVDITKEEITEKNIENFLKILFCNI